MTNLNRSETYRTSRGSIPNAGLATEAAPSPGVGLGRLFGIAIRADWSLLFIFGLIAVNLGAGVFPVWHSEWAPALRWGVAIGAAVLFFVSILLHELAHATVGRALGARIGGITLFMFGGLTHIEREPTRPVAELLMAIVGPLMSLIIGVLAIYAGAQLGPTGFAVGVASGDLTQPLRHLAPLATLLLWLGPVNVMLALFNMLPGFPLDGGRVLRAVLWMVTKDLNLATRWTSTLGQGFGWAMIALGVSMIFGVVVPLLGGGLLQGFWLMLIGWFLNDAARAAYQRMQIQDAVKGLPVKQLMDIHVDSVPPNLTIGSLVHERLLHSEQRCYPVASNGTLEGLVCLDDIRRVARSAWDDTPISHVMTPASSLIALTPDDQASKAVELMTQKDVDQIPVVDHGMLRGLVRRRDIIRWVGLQQAPT